MTSTISAKTDQSVTRKNELKAVIVKEIEFKSGKRIGEWIIEKKIDEGEYGVIYKVKNEKSKTFAALKVESNALEGGSTLKLEVLILRKLKENRHAPHFAELFTSAKHDKYSYMVMTLLGPDLKQLLNKCGSFSPVTLTRVGMQCLYAIKCLHDQGFVHRHIRPSNFVLGHPGSDTARIVHLIDFGLARQFAYYDPFSQTWRQREPRKNVLFRGDPRYVSPFVHRGREHTRLDDLYSLYYMLIEFTGTFMWRDDTDVDVIEKKKNQFDSVFVYPWERPLHEIVRPTDAVYCSKPDYFAFFSILKVNFEWEFQDQTLYLERPVKVQLLNDGKVDYNLEYDWEVEEPKNKDPSIFPYWQLDEDFYKSNVLQLHPSFNGLLYELKWMIREVK